MSVVQSWSHYHLALSVVFSSLSQSQSVSVISRHRIAVSSSLQSQCMQGQWMCWLHVVMSCCSTLDVPHPRGDATLVGHRHQLLEGSSAVGRGVGLALRAGWAR